MVLAAWIRAWCNLASHLKVTEGVAGDGLVECLEHGQRQERPGFHQVLEDSVDSTLSRPRTGRDMKSPCKVLGVR